jgi:methylmalonyl-CoA epimerase
MLTAIDHIGIAVEDIDSALPYYLEVLGLPLVHRETLGEQAVEAALLDLGKHHLELVAPLTPETGLGRFLARRGPGMHHIAYRVEGIEQALAALANSGVQLIDERPRTGIRGSRVAFLHPSATGGVLTEIVEPASAHVFH